MCVRFLTRERESVCLSNHGNLSASNWPMIVLAVDVVSWLLTLSSYMCHVLSRSLSLSLLNVCVCVCVHWWGHWWVIWLSSSLKVIDTYNKIRERPCRPRRQYMFCTVSNVPCCGHTAVTLLSNHILGDIMVYTLVNLRDTVVITGRRLTLKQQSWSLTGHSTSYTCSTSVLVGQSGGSDWTLWGVLIWSTSGSEVSRLSPVNQAL